MKKHDDVQNDSHNQENFKFMELEKFYSLGEFIKDKLSNDSLFDQRKEEENFNDYHDGQLYRNPSQISLRNRDFNDQENDRKVSLTFIKHDQIDLPDVTNIPFIYQEHLNLTHNFMMMLDITGEEPRLKNFTHMNPSSEDFEHLFENEQGFNCFIMCRSSNWCKDNYRLSVFSIYKEKLGKITCQEYLMKPNIIKLISIKQILLS